MLEKGSNWDEHFVTFLLVIDKLESLNHAILKMENITKTFLHICFLFRCFGNVFFTVYTHVREKYK